MPSRIAGAFGKSDDIDACRNVTHVCYVSARAFFDKQDVSNALISNKISSVNGGMPRKMRTFASAESCRA